MLEELRAEEKKLIGEFLKGCERLLELDAKLLDIHNRLNRAGAQSKEILFKAVVIQSVNDLLSRARHQQRKVDKTTRTMPNQPARQKRTFGLKR